MASPEPSLDPKLTVDHEVKPTTETVDSQMLSTSATGPYVAPSRAQGLNIPGYRIKSEIAKGGMGRVYAAFHETLDREVAIKMLLPGASAARFVTEAKITARLPHPNIPPVHDLGRLDDGTPYLAMKLIRGSTLAELLANRKSDRTELAQFVQIFEQITLAVGFAHSRGILHRDLKPLNVMVGDFGEVQVMDWGLAKDATSSASLAREPGEEASANEDNLNLTSVGSVMGTPGYMAPEQARGEVVDARADVFALGAILATILTGNPAFVGSTVKETIIKAASADLAEVQNRLRSCGSDADLIAIAMQCIVADRESRPENGTAVSKLVADYRRGVDDRLRQAETDRKIAEVRTTETGKRQRMQIWATGVIVAVLLAGIVGTTLGLLEARQRQKSESQARAAAESNFEKAVKSAEVVSEELARGIRPIAGTQSQTVIDILNRAEAVYDDLLDSKKPPARARLNKAKMLVLVSDVYRGMARLRPAMERAEQAVEMSSQLVAENPDAREYTMALASAYHKRGWALWDMSKATKALADFDQSIRLFESVGVTVENDPDDTYSFASALTLSGNILFESGNANAARDRYSRGLELREALYQRFPDDPQMGMQLAISLERFALFNLKMEERSTGFSQLERSLKLNEAAYASDPNNSEFARSLIRNLNGYGLEIVGTDRTTALEYLGRAKELSEKFAKRDPNDNLWLREEIRAKWLAAELDKAEWIRLTPEQRSEARSELVRIIQLIKDIARERIRQSPENGLWLADYANMQGRLAKQLQESAKAGDSPNENLALALTQAKESAEGYTKLLELDPYSYDSNSGLLYALWLVRSINVSIEPNADALLAHWNYARANVKTWHEFCIRSPAHVESRTNFRNALFSELFPQGPLADNWMALSNEPRIVAAMVRFAEVLADLDNLHDEQLRSQAIILRGKMALHLNRLSESIPIGAQGEAVHKKLRPQDARQAIEFDGAVASEFFENGQKLQAAGDFDRAIIAYRQALQLTPDDDRVHLKLAWLLATCPIANHRDGKQAIRFALGVCERSAWENPAHIGTLAAAYAEAGDFAKAIELQAKATEFPESDPYMKARREDRLKLFQSGLPYRDAPQPVVVPPELQERTYAATFPSESVRTVTAVEVGFGTMTIIQDTSQFKQTTYLVATNIYPQGSLKLPNQNFLEKIRNGSIGEGQLLTEETSAFGQQKHPMREFTFLKDGTYLRNRIILVENRLFQILIASDDQSELNSVAANAFFSSFTLDLDSVTKFNRIRQEREKLLEAQLDDFLGGQSQPMLANEAITLAEYSLSKSHFAHAIQLYEIAFSNAPNLAEDLASGLRYHAAVYAVRAALGEGEGAPTDPHKQAALRSQALAWLQADLNSYKKWVTSEKSDAGGATIKKMTAPFKETHLAETLPSATREGWTPQEIVAWNEFWVDVRAFQND